VTRSCNRPRGGSLRVGDCWPRERS
jgi:hypothetical protein